MSETNEVETCGLSEIVDPVSYYNDRQKLKEITKNKEEINETMPRFQGDFKDLSEVEKGKFLSELLAWQNRVNSALSPEENSLLDKVILQQAQIDQEAEYLVKAFGGFMKKLRDSEFEISINSKNELQINKKLEENTWFNLMEEPVKSNFVKWR